MIAGRLRRLPAGVLLALPGALTVYTAFRGGGYFAGTQGTLAVGLAIVLVLWVLLAGDPLAGASRGLVVAGLALSLYAGWVLASALWSHAAGRSVLEFDRALLYLLVLMVFGLVPMTPGRLRWIVRGLALAIAAVCAVGFVSRVLPLTLPIAYDPGDGRLAYPITYSNALGLLGVLGAILVIHLTADDREPRPVRVLAAMAVPVIAVTVYLTFSRAPLLIGAIGLAVYLVLARPRLFLSGALSAGLATAIALATAYSARTLASTDHASGLLVAQGRHVAQVLVVCVLGAGLARALLLALDAVIARRRWVPRRVGWASAAVATAAAAAVFASAGGPDYLGRQYRVFATGPITSASTDLRSRFLDASSNGRPDFWRVALRTFATEPLHGHGAGTYQELWNRYRPYGFQLFDGHSLYLESLAELGLVGLALVAVALVTILFAIARRVRGPDRGIFAAIFAAALTWALHAGVDWDWEMPVVTLWVFALGGAVLAVPVSAPAGATAHAPRRGGATLRLVAALGCLVLAVMPARVALSQRHLNRTVSAFGRHDCPQTVREALASIRAIDVRPEPYQLLSYCDVALGSPALAVRAMEAAVSRDPGDWEYRYGLALVRGAAGLDPRPAARRAHALNPIDGLPTDALKRFATGDPRLWRTRALEASLPPS